MSEPLNPNTLLPMSLEVDKIEQLKQIHNIEQQQLISRQRKEKERAEQNRINSKDKLDSVKISEEKGSSRKKKQKENDNKGENQDQKEKNSGKKGKYIDIKV